MSVVVRMEMPTSCEKCPACDYEEGNCLLADDRNTLPHNGKRRAWCPILCQLPEGHGRLVDADKEIAFHVNDYERVKTEGIDVYSKMYSLYDLCDGITYVYDHADIIVPAERSET